MHKNIILCTKYYSKEYYFQIINSPIKDEKKKKRKSKGKVKNQLIRSLKEDEVVENKERKAKYRKQL